ncbi:trypsin-7-like [Culex pipiens pallens]|uniref:trypsin-7-like n=1 Tax=Culex pipiens pallens TaxID=42434 RepID=UPI0019537C57|nr:trypsin-7-like [Culex pipiens pallens]
MKFLVVLSVCLAVATAGPAEDIWLKYNRRMPKGVNLRQDPPSSGGRIVGGVETNIINVPYQLSLREYGSHICGGSVISEQWALSAAHCVYPMPDVETLTLRGGSTSRLEDGYIFEVAEIVIHPQYDPYNIENDAALLRTVEPLVGFFISPIALMPINEDMPAGTRAVVSGWGLMSVPGSLPVNLRMVSVPIIDQDQCAQAWPTGWITDDMICASEPLRSSCNGDSGGPLVVGGRQIGIVSWGQYGCWADFPTVFARVSNARIRNFISEVAGV